MTPRPPARTRHTTEPVSGPWRGGSFLANICDLDGNCVYVTDSGGRLTMDATRDRLRAFRALDLARAAA